MRWTEPRLEAAAVEKFAPIAKRRADVLRRDAVRRGDGAGISLAAVRAVAVAGEG